MKTSRLLILFIFSAALFNSCGPKTVTTDYGKVALLPAKEIIGKTDSAYLTPQYLSSTLKIKFKSKDANSSFSVKLRMQKDEKIWVNVSFLGFNVARGLITPKGFSMYERQNNSYFEGDYKYLSKLIGTELNFHQIQSLLFGKPINDINAKKYKTLISKNSFLLEYTENKRLTKQSINNGDYIQRYWYNPINYQLEQQILTLPDRSNTILAKNSDFELIENKYNLPAKINLKIIEESVTLVDIEFKGIKVDKELSFPFRIPSGFKQLKI